MQNNPASDWSDVDTEPIGPDGESINEEPAGGASEPNSNINDTSHENDDIEDDEEDVDVTQHDDEDDEVMVMEDVDDDDYDHYYNYVPRHYPMTPEAEMNRLLDQQCEPSLLTRLLWRAFSADNLSLFQAALEACYHTYDPDQLPDYLDLIDESIQMGAGDYLSALLKNQCKGKVGARVLEAVPRMSKAMLALVFEQCGDIIPRHAIQTWKSDASIKTISEGKDEYDPESVYGSDDDKEEEDGEEEGEIIFDWDKVDNGISHDIDTQIMWPITEGIPLNSNEPLRFVGLFASYLACGQGVMLLDQDLDHSFISHAGPSSSRSTPYTPHFHHEGEFEGHRFPASFGLLPESWDGCMVIMGRTGNSLITSRDDGPIILVYRESDLVFPESPSEFAHWGLAAQNTGTPAATVTATSSTEAMETSTTATTSTLTTNTASPSPRWVKEVQLQRGDLVVCVPPSLQAVISEMNLRGSLYGVEPECVHHFVSEMMRNLYLKARSQIEIGIAVVI